MLDVRKTIYVLLPIEQAVVNLVAQHLHLSVRSMQRQLEMAGTDFSTLLDEVRHDLAQRYLTERAISVGTRCYAFGLYPASVIYPLVFIALWNDAP